MTRFLMRRLRRRLLSGRSAGQKRGVTQYVYANNHYSGHPPATTELFRDLWYAKGLPEQFYGFCAEVPSFCTEPADWTYSLKISTAL